MTYQMLHNSGPEGQLPAGNVLIVEDNAILACDLEDVIMESGAAPVGPAFSLAEGIRLVEEIDIDAALLDINLGDELVWPLARRLMQKGKPFAFLSAACASKDLPDDLRDAICLDKPASMDHIVDTIRFLLAK